MRYLFLLAVLAAGCVTSKPVMTPDGSQGFFIECSRGADLCMDEAARLCPSGYNVLGSGSSVSHIQQTYGQAYGSAGHVQGQATTVTTPVYRGSMTIACRKSSPPPKAEPAFAESCPVASGRYLVRLRRITGNCANFDDMVADYAGKAWQVPETCAGKATTSPNGCDLRLDYTCPPTEKRLGMRHDEHTIWNGDASRGDGTVEMAFAREGHSCAGTYIITYTRQ